MSVRLIKTQRFGDDRGWFAETYSARRLSQLGVDTAFVQDNQSFSAPRGVLRGFHFQAPPHAQAKLVRCLRGRIWDVALDIRAGSPTYGRWTAHELSADNGLQLFIPVGFAHAFLTLEPDTEVAYKASDFYAPECEGGLIWDDTDIAVPWPLQGGAAILSDKDRRLPTLAAFTSPFAYDGAPLEPLEAVS